MGLFDKLKNIFMEEELIEVNSEDNVFPKIKVEVEEEEKKEAKDLPVEVELDKDEVSDRALTNTNQRFKFPIIFEDDDFKEEKMNTQSINVLERENNKYEAEPRKEIKPQKKTFKPSPVISPVYGILDKNYTKEDLSSKDGLLEDYEGKVDIDTVIKKAYGEKKVENILIETEEKMEEVEAVNLFEDTNEEEVEYSIEEIDEKIKSIDDLLKDTSDDDFYSLVDSMYKDEEGEEV